MSREDTRPDDTSRRGFLKLAGVGTVAGGVAALGAGEAAALPADETPDVGYRETPHIKTYYDSAKF